MDYKSIIENYVTDLQNLAGALEEVKKNKFQDLLRRLFPNADREIGEYTQNLEKAVRIENSHGMLTTGRIDAYFGNLVIEFERDLPRKLDEGKQQVVGYCAGLWNQSRQRKNYTGIVTDGLSWYIYCPTTNLQVGNIQNADIELIEIDRHHLTTSTDNINAFFYLLNRLFFREGQIDPSIENFKKDFGLSSVLFHGVFTNLKTAFTGIRDNPEINLCYVQWQKYLSYTYGDLKTTEDLYLRHSYLAILARFIVWAAISKGQNEELSGPNLISELLSGAYFQKKGIENLVENDFFHWITHSEVIAVLNSSWLMTLNQLKTYDLSLVKEDVLKGLYQELVDPEDRHDLGEYYTPDWLCEELSKYLFDKAVHRTKNYVPKALDPTCGSGSFLRAYIHKTIEYFEASKQKSDPYLLLTEILNKVVGLDIHPLAVIIAKANYLLAIKDLLTFRNRSQISIPIYLADSLFTPEGTTEQVIFGQNDITLKFSGDLFTFPRRCLDSTTLFDDYVNFANKIAYDIAKGQTISASVFQQMSKRQFPKTSSDDSQILADTLFKLASKLAEKIKNHENTIWSFILRNNFRPLFFKDTFEVILGNPPWLTYNYIKDVSYQHEIKALSVTQYGIAPKKSTLMTQMELATLFLVHVTHNFLKKEFYLGFVMPRSVLNGDQHANFRTEDWRAQCDITEYWDLEDVKPLFNVPSCVIMATKKPPIKNKDYKTRFYTGALPERDIPLDKVRDLISARNGKLYQCVLGSKTALHWKKITLNSQDANYYKTKFFQGATIVPRNFYFIKPPTPQEMSYKSFNTGTDEVQRQEAKPPWKSIVMTGKIEKEFLFSTALSKNILPFGSLNLPIIALPVTHENGQFALKTAAQLQQMGFYDFPKWLQEAEVHWASNRGAKNESSIYDWLNYNNKLMAQHPAHPYKVLYNTSGKNISAAKLLTKELGLPFYAESVSYWYDAQTEAEADYLVGILNSSVINDIIKPFQAKGLLGERHIHTKVLEIPYPRFDKANDIHSGIATLSKQAHGKLEKYIETKPEGSIAALRGRARNLVEAEIKGLDKLVKALLDI